MKEKEWEYHSGRELTADVANGRRRWSQLFPSSQMKAQNESSDLLPAPLLTEAPVFVFSFGRCEFLSFHFILLSPDVFTCVDAGAASPVQGETLFLSRKFWKLLHHVCF